MKPLMPGDLVEHLYMRVVPGLVIANMHNRRAGVWVLFSGDARVTECHPSNLTIVSRVTT